MEQPLRHRRGREKERRHRARRLARDRDLVRVSAERRDVVAHPLKCRDLIEQTVVARGAASFRREFRMREEAERADAVVHVDDDDAPLGEPSAVVDRHVTGAAAEAAAVDPHEHGPALALARRRPDVEVQAVLADWPAQQELLRPRAERDRRRLHARRRELVGGAHSAPRGRRAWGAPAHVPDGRGAEGHAQIGANAGACGSGAREETFADTDRLLRRNHGTGRCSRDGRAGGCENRHPRQRESARGADGRAVSLHSAAQRNSRGAKSARYARQLVHVWPPPLSL